MTNGTSQGSALLAVTMGDPAGIGPDITLAAYAARASLGLPAFAVYGCAATFAERAQRLTPNVKVTAVSTEREAARAFEQALPVFDSPLATPCMPGQPTAKNATAVIHAITRAVADIAAGRIAGIITNPIAKSVLKEGGFAHPGHTEFLAELAQRHWPQAPSAAVMMLASNQLKVVPVTIHVSLKDVPRQLTTKRIVETGRIVASALRADFGLDRARLAIAGLNPHAGEHGMLGSEEADIIAPAIDALRAEGIDVAGPLSADTMFHAQARAAYDAALCMYHDQALIPIKTLAFDSGINVTLGLPFVRTSPDHGTAFALAGSNRANATSLIEAIKLAGHIADRRRASARPQEAGR